MAVKSWQGAQAPGVARVEADGGRGWGCDSWQPECRRQGGGSAVYMPVRQGPKRIFFLVAS